MRRSDGARSWVFVINHSEKDVRLELAGTELISGVAVNGLLVAAGGVAVVRETTAPVGIGA